MKRPTNTIDSGSGATHRDKLSLVPSVDGGLYARVVQTQAGRPLITENERIKTTQLADISSDRRRIMYSSHQVAQYRRLRSILWPVNNLLSRLYWWWLGSRVVSVLDSGAEGPGFKSQSRRCRVTVLGKLFTPVVPLFTKQ